MNDAVSAGADVPAGDVAPVSQAQRIEAAVEKVLASELQAAAAVEPVAADPGAPSKLEAARAVYLAWRNESLGGLPTESFNKIEQASASLIAAIAAI